MLEHGSGAQITKLGLNESAQVAGGAMLHAEDSVQLIVVLDDHARTHLGGGNRHTEKTPNGYLLIGVMQDGKRTCGPTIDCTKRARLVSDAPRLAEKAREE